MWLLIKFSFLRNIKIPNVSSMREVETSSSSYIGNFDKIDKQSGQIKGIFPFDIHEYQSHFQIYFWNIKDPTAPTFLIVFPDCQKEKLEWFITKSLSQLCRSILIFHVRAWEDHKGDKPNNIAIRIKEYMYECILKNMRVTYFDVTCELGMMGYGRNGK